MNFYKIIKKIDNYKIISQKKNNDMKIKNLYYSKIKLHSSGLFLSITLPIKFHIKF
jgi:hypothetical protein